MALWMVMSVCLAVSPPQKYINNYRMVFFLMTFCTESPQRMNPLTCSLVPPWGWYFWFRVKYLDNDSLDSSTMKFLQILKFPRGYNLTMVVITMTSSTKHVLDWCLSVPDAEMKPISSEEDSKNTFPKMFSLKAFNYIERRIFFKSYIPNIWLHWQMRTICYVEVIYIILGDFDYNFVIMMA